MSNSAEKEESTERTLLEVLESIEEWLRIISKQLDVPIEIVNTDRFR